MNYRLDIKKGLLVRSNDGTIASNQQSAISNSFFLIFNVLYYFLLCVFPLFRVLAYPFAQFLFSDAY
jgi:hypothetical protein